MNRVGWPRARARMSVGLLGGSFDPPHAGHAHITHEALKRFGLDTVWWLVSPGNPLKATGPAPMAKRLKAARRVMKHPDVEITDLEARMGTRFTAETIARLQVVYPGVRFVWLMGADNLAEFHRWERWEEIFARVAIGVLARPGERVAARLSPAALRYERYRLRDREAARLCVAEPPAWCFVNVPMVALSSTEIRTRGDW